MELPLPPRLIPRTFYCIVCEDVSNLSLHAFPKRSIDRQKWLEVLNLTEEALKQKPKSKVCAAHFHPTCFSKSATSVPRLMPGSLPNKLPYMRRSEEKVTNDETPLADQEIKSVSNAIYYERERNHTADPTLPMIDECSTFLNMPTVAEIQNISQTIVSSVPIMDETSSSFSMPTAVEVGNIPAIDLLTSNEEYLCPSTFSSTEENRSTRSINHFQSISKYKLHNQGISKIIEHSSPKQIKKNFEVALKTIEKHKKTIKTLQQSNRRLRRKVVKLEELLNNGARPQNLILYHDE